MKNILIVFSHPAPNKVHFFNGLSQHFNLTVVFERKLGSYSKKQYQNNPQYRFQELDIKGMSLGKENHFSHHLIQHLKKHTYDMIIMNGYSSWTEIHTIHFLISQKIPYYLYVNGGVIRKENFLKRMIKQYLISHAKGYFSPTAIVDSYLVHYGAKKNAIHHYPYATIFDEDVIKVPVTRDEKMIIRARYQLSNNHLSISVGQFIHRKNFLALLKFWKSLPSSFELVIVGDGPLLRQYEKFKSKHGLNNVTFKPFQPKHALLEMYRCADAFVLLSKEDIHGHVINEALSQGLPVLTTLQTISGQHLLTNQIGRLVDVKSPNTWRKAFEEVVSLENPLASLQVAKANTFETMIQTHTTLMERILDR